MTNDNDNYRSPYITRYKGKIMRLRMCDEEIHAAFCELEDLVEELQKITALNTNKIILIETHNKSDDR